MVERRLALGLLQLVALSLPAFAILLQMVVESDFPYTKEAVPITTAGFGLVLLAGHTIVADFVSTTQSVVATLALRVVGLGMFGLAVGMTLICLQTNQAQHKQDGVDE